MGESGRQPGVLSWPNRISLMRLFLVGPFVVLLENQNQPGWQAARYAALGIFLVMAVSDFIDGVLARKLDLRTRLGAILDPLADKVLIVCSAVLLSLPASAVPGLRLPSWVVVAIVGKDLYVVAGFLVVYLVTDRFRVRPTIAGKACTFGQLAMVVAVLVGPDLNRLADGLGTGVATVFHWITLTLAMLAMVSYLRLGLIFLGEGQRPLDDHASRAGDEGDA